MFTSRMVKLLAVVLDRYTEKVTEVMLREGVIQFINIKEIDGEFYESLKEVDPSQSTAVIAKMRGRIQTFLNTAGIIPDPPGEVDLVNRKPVDLEKERAELDRIADELKGFRERQRALWQEVLKIEDMKRHVKSSGINIPEGMLGSEYSFIETRFGKVPKKELETIKAGMKDWPNVLQTLGEENSYYIVFVIFMKRDRDKVVEVLQKTGWADMERPGGSPKYTEDLVLEFEDKIRDLNREREELAVKAREYIEQKSERLNSMWVQLRIYELFGEVKSYFKKSARTVIFSGWLPVSKQRTLTQDIQDAAEGNCYLEWYEPEVKTRAGPDENGVPVLLNNPKLLSPFQMLVTNFGIPEYGTVDPTLFVVLTYLVMFGLMFADVGQGAVLALAGLVGMRVFKEKQETWRNLSKLIIWCGLSSIVSGFLFGSYFGMDLVRPVWFDFHGIISGHAQKQSYIMDLFDVLAISVYFGIAVISTGILFNWINLVKKRRWLELFFEKSGVVGGWFFGGGIYVTMYLISHKYQAMPDLIPLFLLVGLPAVLLFFKAPLYYLKERKIAETGFTVMTLFDFVMHWIVELLEIFSGYLSNTLSFMRVAGLGIAHVSLMIAFSEIAGMVTGVGGPKFISILILVFGNVLVIGLEGLTAGVQALRLNYYEFFSKFFSGTGRLFNPVSLKSRV
jgi:V/A-type H+-transporting ATPase subunit I